MYLLQTPVILANVTYLEKRMDMQGHGIDIDVEPAGYWKSFPEPS